METVDVKLIKSALEEASFNDPELRQKVYECIDELQADLEDAEYKSTVGVNNVFDELEDMLNAIEEAESEEEDEKDDIDPTVDDENDDEDDEDNDDDEDDDDDEDYDDDDVPDELKNL